MVRGGSGQHDLMEDKETLGFLVRQVATAWTAIEHLALRCAMVVRVGKKLGV